MGAFVAGAPGPAPLLRGDMSKPSLLLSELREVPDRPAPWSPNLGPDMDSELMSIPLEFEGLKSQCCHLLASGLFAGFCPGLFLLGGRGGRQGGRGDF